MPRAITISRTVAWSGSSIPAIARAWPSLICPSASAAWTTGASSSSRSELATVDRARPTFWAICSCVSAEVIDQLPVGVGLLERTQVRPLEVLHERQLELMLVGELANDRRDAHEPGQARGADATLARDELVALEGLGHEDGLEDTVRGDAGREGLQLGPVDRAAGLVGVGNDPVERDLGRRLDRAGSTRDERREPPSERRRTLAWSGGHDSIPWATPAGTPASASSTIGASGAARRSRRMNSSARSR